MISSIAKSGTNGATTGAKAEAPRGGLSTGSHLLVQAGEYVCALPLVSVRRVLRSLTVHPLPGSTPELEGLAEFGGEPLPVLNLARLVNAAPGANPAYPVTIVVWTGPPDARELMGLAADAALEVADVPPGSVVIGGGGGMSDGGFVLGEAPVAGKVVRVINLEALGQER
jgi:chemotaxis signal transduction protein